MAFYLGSFTSGMFSGAQDVVGMFDTVAQTQQRRAQTKSLEQETTMKQKAFDAAAAADKAATSGQPVPGAQDLPASSTGPSSAGDGAVAPTDLNSVSQPPAHLRALRIPGTFNQGAPAGSYGTSSGQQAPYSERNVGAIPTAQPPAYTDDTPSSEHARAPAPAAAPSGSAQPINTLAPYYQSPMQRMQALQPRTAAPHYTPNQGIPAGPAPNAPTPAMPGSNPMSTGPTWIGQNGTGQNGTGQNGTPPGAGRQMMMPSLASGQAGMGASILAAMNPTAGSTA